MTNDKKYIESIVKGKIAELLCEMIFREDPNKTFTIIPFGYEKTTPELAQYHDLIKNVETLAVIRQSPDFILIKNDKSKVHFVEVKYRRYMSKLVKDDLLRRAKIVSQYWMDTYFFVAVQDGFYFDSCENIIRNSGLVGPLNDSIISSEIQSKFLMILKEFIEAKNKK